MIYENEFIKLLKNIRKNDVIIIIIKIIIFNRKNIIYLKYK